jgi:hypothetical protein
MNSGIAKGTAGVRPGLGARFEPANMMAACILETGLIESVGSTGARYVTNPRSDDKKKRVGNK